MQGLSKFYEKTENWEELCRTLESLAEVFAKLSVARPITILLAEDALAETMPPSAPKHFKSYYNCGEIEEHAPRFVYSICSALSFL